MGREIRRVPRYWKHPTDVKGNYIALYDGYAERAAEFLDMIKNEGLQKAVEYFGGGPDKNDYMPNWPEEEKTRIMMYETCSEGTPISPSFDTCEELARWLSDNNASAFGSMTASYEQWLATCKAGWAVSAIYDNINGFRSGVEAIGE